jgi:prophage regulatory protein
VAKQSVNLMGAHEIRVRLGGISRQRVYQLTSRADFPSPIADLVQGKVWLSADVEAWIATRRSSVSDA